MDAYAYSPSVFYANQVTLIDEDLAKAEASCCTPDTVKAVCDSALCCLLLLASSNRGNDVHIHQTGIGNSATVNTYQSSSGHDQTLAVAGGIAAAGAASVGTCLLAKYFSRFSEISAHLMDLQAFRKGHQIASDSQGDSALNCREYALTTERNYMIAKLIFTVAAVVGAVFVVSALLIAPELVGIAAIILGVSALLDLFTCMLEHYSDINRNNVAAKEAFKRLAGIA